MGGPNRKAETKPKNPPTLEKFDREIDFTREEIPRLFIKISDKPEKISLMRVLKLMCNAQQNSFLLKAIARSSETGR